jgi:hypothetical protein
MVFDGQIDYPYSIKDFTCGGFKLIVDTTLNDVLSFRRISDFVAVIPVVGTTTILNISNSSVSINSILSGDGGDFVTERGICWDTIRNPTISLSTKTNDGTGIGTFTSSISGLFQNRVYYLRTYAVNSAGVAYGPEISFSVPAITFRKKVLVEFLTGTWSGYDPRVIYKLESYKNNHPECIITTIHGGLSTDPFRYLYYPSYNSVYNLTGYPSAVVNRSMTNSLYRWNEDTTILNNIISESSNIGLFISSTLNGTNVSGIVKVRFGTRITTPLKIIIAHVENGLQYPQRNLYSPTYGPDPITNQIHNGILRTTTTNLFGDEIPLTSQNQNDVYELPFSFSLSGNVYGGGGYTSDANKSAIVAFVVDGNTNSTIGVYNVQYAQVGTMVDFEQIQ